jgi:hypothetical protein
MKITLTSDIFAADTEARTLTGRVLPFGEVGRPKSDGLGSIVFAQDSVNIAEPSAIKLNLEHDRTRPIGKAVALESRADGIWATFALVNTTAANDALIEAAAGLRNGFSIEVVARDLDRGAKVTTVKAADMTGVALVTNPAYSGAGVTEIAAVDDEPEVSEADPAEDVSTEGETVEETTTPDAPKVEASAAPAANLNAAPLQVKSRSAIVDQQSYLAYSIKAAVSDDPEIAGWVREFNDTLDRVNIAAADDTTSTNTGLTLADHLPMWVSATTGAEPVAEACGGYMALPSTGMSFTIPRQLVAPTVATVAEAGSLSETGLTSDYLTATVVKKAGRNEVSWELAERSLPSFLPILNEQLNRALAKNKEEYVIALLTAGGTAASTQAGTVAGLQAFVGTESVAAYTATGGDFATELVTNGSWWSALINANDTTNRPLFPEVGPMNAPGDVSSRSDRGNVFGANFYVSPNMTSGLVDESAFLIDRNSVALWQSPVSRVQVNRTTDGMLEVALYQFLTGVVLKAGGVRRFNLT